MDSLIAIVILALSFRCMYLMYSRGADYYLLGVTGGFSIGYYVLPVFFKSYSGLSSFSEFELFEVLFMSLLFFMFLYIGHSIAISRKLTGKLKGINFYGLDDLFIKSMPIVYGVCILIWWFYVINYDLTSYQSEDSQAYFTNATALSGVVSYLSGLAISSAIYITALAYCRNEKTKFIIYSFITIISLVPLLYTAQRLAVITPFIAFFAALGINGMHKTSMKILGLSMMVLLFVSPAMVFLRELGNSQGSADIYEIFLSVFYGQDSYIIESFKSVMARADLLSVMIQMKEYFEMTAAPGLIYYISVIASFVPRFMWPSKPYPLSDDGTIYGEISVVAWSQLVSPDWLGSLSAFGSIMAYREGGWLWVPFNGLLVGALFALTYILLVRGGHISRLLFCSIIASICVKNVPPSFFSLLVVLSTTVLLMMSLKFISLIVPKRSISKK